LKRKLLKDLAYKDYGLDMLDVFIIRSNQDGTFCRATVKVNTLSQNYDWRRIRARFMLAFNEWASSSGVVLGGPPLDVNLIK
ncbi:MAG: hypothetical protein OXI59_18625, partial [Gemmatimonadota bacterium]|nr:hypothetical protein [Gemmatimonadota bacterium]